MYEYIKGVVTATEEQAIVLENNGIAYHIAVTPDSIRILDEGDGDVLVYTHLVHREDAMELYGFADQGERVAFRLLLSLSGIGPRQALKILSGMPLAAFVKAVQAGDITALTSIPGLGKKRAEKVIFELKDKLDGFGPFPEHQPEADGAALADAVLALEALGFSGMMARTAVRKAKQELGDEAEMQALIRAALRHV